METDIIMEEERPHRHVNDEEKPRKFVIAMDFGTTCSAVAYVALQHDKERPTVQLKDIKVIENFPSGPANNYGFYEVPSEITYSPNDTSQAEEVEVPSFGIDTPSDTDTEYGDHCERGVSNVAATRPNSPPVSPAAPAQPALVHWGFQVQERLKKGELNSSPCGHLERFKLMLDNSEVTKCEREKLAAQCKVLEDLNLIKAGQDIIVDYLERLMQCVKRELVRWEDFQEEHDLVELVLCVPAAWRSSALWAMQVALTEAAKRSGLGWSRRSVIDNLFMVSEPEAAAACIVASGAVKFKLDEVFMVLDAGGGTVDAVTYKVTKTNPLRLAEIIESRGELCGSSFINERYRTLLEQRLKEEKYLEADGETLAQKIDAAVVGFEKDEKRLMDVWDEQAKFFTVMIPGLRENKALGFGAGRLRLSTKDIEKFLFRPSLRSVAKLMNEQLDQSIGYDIEKVILMGGFGQSVRLERYLRGSLAQRAGEDIKLVLYNARQQCAAAIARGGVYRALRKKDGPTRHLQSSFGFLRSERYGEYEEHADQLPHKDPVDGHRYIYNTIDWVLEKGKAIPPEHVIDRMVENTFKYKEKQFICTEALYVSDQWHPSHYHYEHPLNQGALLAGRVQVDVRDLRKKAYRDKAKRKSPYWETRFKLRIIVNGRSLRYEVIPIGSETARKAGQVSMAAAFHPGTE